MTSPDDRYRPIHVHMARGERDAASSLVADLLANDPVDARAHFLHGRLLLGHATPDRALAAFARAAELDPATAEFHAWLGWCHAEFGTPADALRHAAAAADLPADDRTLDLIAAIESRFGRHRAAAALLSRAIEAGSRVPAIHFNLAAELKFCGDFTGARRALERAIELDPAHIKARAALSALRPASIGDNQLDAYEALLERTLDPAQRLHLCHAAAREYEAVGDYDRAFALLDLGKTGMRRIAGVDPGLDQALFDALHQSFAEPRTVAGHAGPRPIFVVGMPRSGTTVVDRILSGHPSVASVGETLLVSELLQRMVGRQSPLLIDPRDIAALASLRDLAAIGRDYMARLPPHDRARTIDKFHLNSLLAGFVLRALPDARVVCVVRGAMDTIVSNYRQLFDYRSGLYRYGLSIETIARFYVGFRRITERWAESFPERFRIVSYERLVTSPESVAREMFAFCDLDWHTHCLRIEDNAAPIATASAVQVRQPLNARSIGTWRRYERHLGAARAIVADAGYGETLPAA